MDLYNDDLAHAIQDQLGDILPIVSFNQASFYKGLVTCIYTSLNCRNKGSMIDSFPSYWCLL